MDNSSLKQLNRRKAVIEQELYDIRRKQSIVQKNLNEKMDELKSIQKKIEQLTLREIVVSEHAIIRYLERVKGINMDEIRREILTDKVRMVIDTISSGSIPINDSMTLKVVNRVVTTVLTDTEPQ